MGVDNTDSFAVDDDVFLNGGLPLPDEKPSVSTAPGMSAAPSTPAPAPAPVAAPAEPKAVVEPAPIAPVEPKAVEPAPVAPAEPEMTEPKPTPAASSFSPINSSSSLDTKEEIPDETQVASRETHFQPSASFQEEMQEAAKKEAAEKEAEDLNDWTNKPTEKKEESHQGEMSHVSGVTPSQAMIPDGMLAQNRIKLDDDEEDEEPEEEAMVPSQAMAEGFVAAPLRIPAMEAAAEKIAEDEANANKEEADEEPVVTGPMISSAGMESLTEEQAENPTANIQAESMKMEAKIDDEPAGKPAAQTEATASEPTPAPEPALAPTPTPAPETTPTTETTSAPEPTPAPEQTTPASTEPETTPAPAPAPEPTPTPDPTPTTSTNGVAPHAKSTHPALFIVIGIIALIVIGLIVFAIISSLNSGESNDTSNNKVEKNKSITLGRRLYQK